MAADSGDPTKPTKPSDLTKPVETTEPVEAVRSAPGEFFVATDRITRGLQFRVAGSMFEVVGDPSPIGYLAVMAQIRDMATGAELTACLRGGRHKPDPVR